MVGGRRSGIVRALGRAVFFVDLAGVSLYNETWTALVQPAVVSAPIHCDLPCNNDNDCGGGEVCVSSVCVLE